MNKTFFESLKNAFNQNIKDLL